ncbi:MAG: biotin--[acetyl-CoA-carboxylase] ligase [Bacteroidota bacterium]
MFAKIKPNTHIIGQNIVYFQRVDSTNTLALDLLKNKLSEHGTVVIADHQTSGRGQRNNEWTSHPNENLTFSVILHAVTNTRTHPFNLNKCITLGLHHFITNALPNHEVKIKWPNDIYVNNEKIAGILIENNYMGQQLQASVVGIGLNVNQSFQNLSHLKATSFKDLQGFDYDRPLVFRLLLEALDNYFLKLDADQTEAINNLFNSNLLGYGVENAFTDNALTEKYIIKGCDEEGRILLEKDGATKAYLHGELKQVIA